MQMFLHTFYTFTVGMYTNQLLFSFPTMFELKICFIKMETEIKTIAKCEN